MRPLPLLVWASLTLTVTGQVLDELLSARCQAKCLADFEAAAKGKGIRRRTLKHTIIPLCKGDPQCSACASPCQEPFESVSRCKRTACKETSSKRDCVASCQFLHQIFRRRAGSCPRRRLDGPGAGECVAECRRDGDCGAGQKCCARGCGRACVPVELRRGGDGAWLPVPQAVTVEERRRGRSAILRWVLPALRPHQTATAANLYLIQWRWGLGPDPASMNAWQTVAVRNKLYAILKHLLSPGRYYLFRVAAVNRNGTLGFSKPSRPFRLSRSPRAPGAPLNLNPGRAILKSSGLIEQEISWLPPKSDLPIVHYQVTWAPAPQPQSSALIQADSPSLSEAEREEEGAIGDFSYHKSRLLPAAINSAELDDLRPGTKYLVEVVAIVGAPDAEISGDKATLLLEPQVPGDSISTTETPQTTVLTGSLAKVRAGTAFYEAGSLRNKLSWRYSGPPGAEFAISWWPRGCSHPSDASSPDEDSWKPSGALSKASSFVLSGLRFGCSYAATVAAVSPSGEAGALPATLARASLEFTTPECSETESDEPLDCPTPPPALPKPPQNLRCSAKTLGRGLLGGECRWEAATSSAHSYRVLLSRRLGDGGLAKEWVRLVKLRRVVLERLEAGGQYRLEVRALGHSGPSPPASVDFDAPDGTFEDSVAEESPRQTQAAVIVQLDEVSDELHHVTSYSDSGAASPPLLSSLLLLFISSLLFVLR